jgi:predicted Zn-dependent protease
MRTKFLIQLLAFALLCAGVFFAVYALFPEKWLDRMHISKEQEQEWGQTIRSWMTEGEDVIQHPELDSALQRIERRFRTADTLQYDFNFTVIQSEEVNAFALPGGEIVIYSGLIAHCNHPEELAAVIAHEMGHAEKQHVLKRMVGAVGVTTLGQVLGGQNGSVVSDVIQELVLKGFSRSQEEEADQFALLLLKQAQLDPGYLASVFQILADLEEESLDGVPEMLMTHPNVADRIQQATEFAVKNPVETVELNISNWENRGNWIH